MSNRDMSKVAIDLDAENQMRWVTEAQYTGGHVVRQYWIDSEVARNTFVFLRDRASTDWVKLFRVNIETGWEEVDHVSAVPHDLLNEAIRAANNLVIRLATLPTGTIPKWADEAIRDADLLLNQVRDGLEDPQ